MFLICTLSKSFIELSNFFTIKGIASKVCQLYGGIHKYLEKYPDGHFKGKLFVFDNRYAISYNDQVISECSYCKKPWDQYKLCSSQHCKQLVLSCTDCRNSGRTACCSTCAKRSDRNEHIEQCDCTVERLRVPDYS